MIQHTKLLIACCVVLSGVQALHAQALPAPQSLRSYRSGPENTVVIVWDSVAKASEYRIDVSSDSTFTNIVYGMSDFPQSLSTIFFDGDFYLSVFLAQRDLGKTGMALFNRCFTTLYFRVRAENAQGERGLYSTTSSISQINSQPCDLSPSPKTIVGKLSRQSISYYEGPLAAALGFKNNNLMHYFSPNASDIALLADSAQKLLARSSEEILQLLTANNVPIDTAWCHDGGEVRIPYFIIDKGPSPSGRHFFVKLRRPDSRIKGYGFVDSLPQVSTVYLWRYSITFLYYRYTPTTTTSVSIENAAEPALSTCYPNPATDQITLSFNLAQQADVGITIIDPKGNTVLRQPIQHRPAGMQALLLDIRALISGVYNVRLHVQSERGITTVKTMPFSVVR